MGVKEFLERAIHLDGLIDIQMAELDQYRRLSLKISSSRLEEHVSHSAPTEAPYAKWVERIVDKEREMNDSIDRLLAAREEINSFIDGVSNPRWQRILHSRYIMGFSWSKIAQDMGCTVRHAQRIHQEILKNLDNVAFRHKMS